MPDLDKTTSQQNLSPEKLFALAGLMALGVRLVQGWVYWGGASRRLFYDFATVNGSPFAVKLDPNVAGYVANKLVHAMPGAVWPAPPMIEWLALHGGVLLVMVWFWTLVELVVGVGLIFGIATRLLALVSVGLSIMLMMIFGWMGSTCVDEWTMAASSFAMGSLLMITGGGAWSIDQWIARRWPGLGQTSWFRWLFSGPLPMADTRRWSIGLGVLSILFTVGFYQYLHGAVISPLHARVNFHHYDLTISDLRATPDGQVRFAAYVDAGPDTGKLYLIGATVQTAQGKVLEHWDGNALSALPKTAIVNRFTRPWTAQIKPTDYGIGGVTGAKAAITLPAQNTLPAGTYSLHLTDIDGTSWTAPVTVK